LSDDGKVQLVSLAEVKNILTKVEKERKELLYEQRIALEHAQKFSKLPVSKTKALIDELKKVPGIEEMHAYKIADIFPENDDDIRTLFAKERITLSEESIKKIIEALEKYIAS
jgi:DNA-directed RNA polymerase subunit F